MPTPRVAGMLEWSIYVADPAASEAFYSRLFGFARLFADARLCALAVGPGQVLLLFRRGASADGIATPGGLIPGHDAQRGEGGTGTHFAFAVRADDLPAWREHLQRQGVRVESEVRWPGGGASLYFRDPDGSLIELATPGIWAVY